MLLLPGAAWAQGQDRPSVAPDLIVDAQMRRSHGDLVEPTGPAVVLPYEPGQAVPVGYRVASGFHTGLLAGGCTLFGFSYVLSIVVATADDAARHAAAESLTGETNEVENPSRRPLYVPLIGPFLAVASDKRSGSAVALMVLDGITQGAGFTLAMFGLATRQQWLEPEDSEQLSLSVTPAGARLTVAF